jgi:hypothetical protein
MVNGATMLNFSLVVDVGEKGEDKKLCKDETPVWSDCLYV